MRIVYVTHQYPPDYNTGTELYAKRMALKVRGAFGHDVRIFTYEPSYLTDEPGWRREETVDDGVAVTRVWGWSGLKANAPLGHYYDVFLGKEFGRYLDAVKPDAIHFFHTAFHGASVLEEAYLRGIPFCVNLMDFWFICPTAQLLRRRTFEFCSGPEVFECLECTSVGDGDHGRIYDFAHLEGFVTPPKETLVADSGLRLNNDSPHACLSALGGRKEFLRTILELADKIFAPSETLKRIFCENGHDPERFEVCRYGVDPMPAYAFARTRPDTLRIGFIGSINRPKGLHLLIEAVSELAGDLRLDIFGNPGMFPDYAKECYDAAELDDRVYPRGAMKPEHVATALRDIDVLVVPSMWHENTPFVVLEARAAGVPVVGANVGGIAEIIEEGRTGRIFEAGDVEALRSVLSDLLNDRGSLRSMTGHFAGVRTLLDNAREFTQTYAALAAKRNGVAEANSEPAGDVKPPSEVELVESAPTSEPAASTESHEPKEGVTERPDQTGTEPAGGAGQGGSNDS